VAPRAPTAFVSYSHEDSAFALRLAGDLKAAGANVWLDQIDIEPGQEWDSAIEDAVTQAPLMLLILSPTSVKSRNVRNEISFALEEKKTIIPALYQDCTVPLQLRRIQHIDFRADYAHGLKALLRTLGVATPAAASATAASAGALHAKGEYSSAVPPHPPPKAASRIRVDSTVQAASLVNKVTPQYPPIAKRAHVSGTVILHAIISKDGSIQELQYVDGPPILMQSAMDAVKEWRYKPTMRNGEPVEVDTTISVVFSFPDPA
jgi:TonB family protein